ATNATKPGQQQVDEASFVSWRDADAPQTGQKYVDDNEVGGECVTGYRSVLREVVRCLVVSDDLSFDSKRRLVMSTLSAVSGGRGARRVQAELSRERRCRRGRKSDGSVGRSQSQWCLAGVAAKHVGSGEHGSPNATTKAERLGRCAARRRRRRGRVNNGGLEGLEVTGSWVPRQTSCAARTGSKRSPGKRRGEGECNRTRAAAAVLRNWLGIGGL
ncbi:hypothetical protein TPAR_03309, partial [Tolypocladium paradoxum]